MALVKSKILDQLSGNYPNFIRKDLSLLIEVILSKIQDALKKNERVELRDVFTLETKIQKSRISRNPRTNEKIVVPKKKTLQFKMNFASNLILNDEKTIISYYNSNQLGYSSAINRKCKRYINKTYRTKLCC